MLNIDFSQAVTINTYEQDWVPSPMPGVWRKPLAREDAERGHATSIVRYEPGASFSAHGHPKGEEILVLDGVFSDQSGDFRAGTYFRNPEGFSHAPFSQEGCVILVKLHQFQADDLSHVTIKTNESRWQKTESGAEILKLHRHGSEQVFMLRTAEIALLQLPSERGLEIYVVAGALLEDGQTMPEGDWLRRPTAAAEYQLTANSVIWVKNGHL